MSFSDTNTIQIARIAEVTPGVTPTTGNATIMRIAGQTLNSNLTFKRSSEINADRMTSDTVLVDAQPSGDLSTETSFNNSDDLDESALCSTYSNLPNIVNATSDTPITLIDSATKTITVVTGNGSSNFKAGMLIQITGTGTSNDTILSVASSTATTIVVNETLSDLAVVPAGTVIRVVGFQQVSGDSWAAVSDGITSTTFDFRTLGLTPYTWIKIGGTGVGNRFVAQSNNEWARVSAVAANKLTLDRLPFSWTTETLGTATLKVWYGDTLKNGKVKKYFSIERQHTDINQYAVYRGSAVNTCTVALATGDFLKKTYAMMSWGSESGGTSFLPNPSTLLPAPTGDVMNAVSDIVNIREGTASAGAIQTLSLQTTNNLRPQKSVAVLGNAGVGLGDFETTMDMTAYFQDGVLIDKFENGTKTSFSFVATQDGQGYVYDMPLVKLEGLTIQAGARNTDATLSIKARALRHAPSSSQLIVGRFHYFEI